MEDKILWGFVGSVITIIITKIFELYKSNRDNKFILQKIYFEKKLNTAEAAISDLYEEISGIDSFVRVYEKITNSPLEQLPNIYKEIEYLKEESKSAVKAVNQIANAMYLYFDLDVFIDVDQTNCRKLLDVSSEIRSLDSEMEIYSKILKEYENSDFGNFVFEEIKKKYPEYIPKLKELVSLGHKAKDDAKKQLENIRYEMKKYDLK